LIDPSLLEALRAIPATAGLRPDDVVAMTAKGVNHDHYRLRGVALVLRAPRATPWLGDAAAQLEVEAAAFRRAEPAKMTPRLGAILQPSAALPRGALLVEEIIGRPPRLPADLPAIADALARLHALELPAPAERPPLPDHSVTGPVAATFAVITRQHSFLDPSNLARETHAALAAEYAWAEGYAAEASPTEQPAALVGTDTHPGNFIMRADGTAVLVDLERVCYGSPAIDLAHATLLTSTRWDIDVRGEPSRAEVITFYRRYLQTIGAPRAAALRPWLLPARRLTWLRTMMWAVRLRVLFRNRELLVEPRLAEHISQWLDAFLSPETVARCRAEWLSEPPLEFTR